jgi:hypothetical protein
MKVNEENCFELCEAIHTFLTVEHEGQFSKKYELLGKSLFNPGALWSETKVIEENYLYSEIESLMIAIENFTNRG